MNPWNHEKQSNLIIDQKIGHRIQAVITSAIRNYQGVVIEHTYKSRCITSWTYVNAVAGLGAPDDHDGGMCDKQPAAPVELVKNGQEPRRRITRPERVLVLYSNARRKIFVLAHV